MNDGLPDKFGVLVGTSEHCPEMLKMSFIIFVMVFSGLALSSVVTELAVRPLERMLFPNLGLVLPNWSKRLCFKYFDNVDSPTRGSI